MTISPSSCSSSDSSDSSTSFYPSSCGSISPPRTGTGQVSSVSPPPRRPRQTQLYDLPARDHLESLIKKHGPPTPVSSTSSLRKLTSTSPIKSSHLPPLSLDTPPASPSAIDVPYVSSSGTQPIPIPRGNSSRDFEDLPLTPLTGRFDQGNLFPRAELFSQGPSRNEKSTRKKKTQAAQSSSSSSSRSKPTKTMQGSHGPSFTMSSQPGRPLSPQHSPKPDQLHLGNLPRFHPAVYQPPNNSSNNQPQQRSYGYRVSSGASRDALRQYRELVAASVALPRNGSSTPGFSKPSAPRLDPLGSPGPVTPLTLEEAESYLAAGSASKDESSLHPRQEGRLAEREARSMDCKGR